MALKEYFDRRVPLLRVVVRALSMAILVGSAFVFALAWAGKPIPDVLPEMIRMSVVALAVLARTDRPVEEKATHDA